MAEERQLRPVRKSPLAMLVDARQAVQKARVRGVVRLKHLERRGMTCKDTEELVRRTYEVEEWCDGRLRELVDDHPTQWWWSHIFTIGRLNIALCIGEIEKFGRYYPEGDPLIPAEVHREVENYLTLDEDQKIVECTGVWVEGIERLITPSKQRVYIGHAPGLKRRRGEKLAYNSDAKMVFWRIGGAFMRGRNRYYQIGYVDYKNYLIERDTAKGKEITATPKERWCPNCEKEVTKKKAEYCPDCGEALSKKDEPEGTLYLGHLDKMARRKMQQLFSDHLNIVWRTALGLSVRDPYPIEKQGHTRIIRPEDMMDRACGKENCPICMRYGLK